MLDGTRKFSMKEESNMEMKRVLQTVYDALKENGYIRSTRLWVICSPRIQHILRTTTMHAA